MDISLARRVNQVQFYFMFKKLQNKAFCSFFRDIAMFHIRLETANTNKFWKNWWFSRKKWRIFLIWWIAKWHDIWFGTFFSLINSFLHKFFKRAKGYFTHSIFSLIVIRWWNKINKVFPLWNIRLMGVCVTWFYYYATCVTHLPLFLLPSL